MSKIEFKEEVSHYRGEIEIIFKDRHGKVVNVQRETNLIKVFAKEMLAHRLPYHKIWDPFANTGEGAWLERSVDPIAQFAPKYILLGASFDENGLPLERNDDRYYVDDPITGGKIVRSPRVGVDNMGDLVNPIPLAEPNRPLKRIENVYFGPSYQPADSPLLQDDVRAVNNIVVFETTLRQNEYNGFENITGADAFTITEIALAGGDELGTIGACECTPSVLFLRGLNGSNDYQIPAVINGATINIDTSVPADDVSAIREGDQIFLVQYNEGTEDTYNTLDQVQPYYLITNKDAGSYSFTLDRAPIDINGNPISGNIGVYRSSLRLFSQRFLTVPFRKTSDFEIIIRWYIRFA